MGYRRKARELVLQVLFYIDATPGDPVEQLHLFCSCQTIPKNSRNFFFKLVKGVISGKNDIDRTIEKFSQNWKVSRMSGVDRNVLRLSVYELVACDDIPSKVTINEAIEIGKDFGSDESGAFINGILDSIHLAMEKENFTIQEDINLRKAIDEPKKTGFTDFSNSPKPVCGPVIARVIGKKGVVKRRNITSTDSDGGELT